ncbi:MAG: hypothetical protein GWM87_15875 [Xanthomonadales bacterium]|nr:hypothetical protein [Xanthomonadales bacterium]NIX14251.1 hypothetical protein [Xanthomonadales bacterium]
MQVHELANHLACIEDHLLRCHWDSWEFELTNTTHLYSPWSNPPLPEVQPSDRVIAKYILRDQARHPMVFCLAELEEDNTPEGRRDKEFLKILASFHATLEELPVAMYTFRGWSWDYANVGAGEDWHENAPYLSSPLEERFVHELWTAHH